MRKLLFMSISIVFLILTNVCYSVYAKSNIKILFDNKEIVFDCLPINVDGRLLVPARKLCEGLDAKIDWKKISAHLPSSGNADGIEIKITKDGEEVYFDVWEQCSGKYKVNKNGLEYDCVTVPSEIIDNRVFLPVRVIAESLGLKVEWDFSKNVVNISSYPEVKKNILGNYYKITYESQKSKDICDLLEGQIEESIIKICNDSFDGFDYEHYNNIFIGNPEMANISSTSKLDLVISGAMINNDGRYYKGVSPDVFLVYIKELNGYNLKFEKISCHWKEFNYYELIDDMNGLKDIKITTNNRGQETVKVLKYANGEFQEISY